MTEQTDGMRASCEAERMQYALRSAFYYRRQAELSALAERAQRLDGSRYDWSDPDALGISPEAWERVQQKDIPPCRVFCHPEVLAADPDLGDYYRLLAVLPQKGLARLMRLMRAAEGKAAGPALQARLLNAHISTLVEADPGFTLEQALRVAYMNFGAQVNGSWRNQIGRTGSEQVKELLLGYFVGEGLVREAQAYDGRIVTVPLESSAVDIQRFTLTNGYQFVFGSEPDVAIRDVEGNLKAAIEVKAGLDPAGAMERYGACKKSFDRALDENKSAATIYLASCITAGVRRAMKKDRLVKEDHDLAAILTDAKARMRFLAHLRWLVHL